MIITENETIRLLQYTHDDDRDMYECWKDVNTQKGYNGVFAETFDEFRRFEIAKFRFWVTILDKEQNIRVGTLRLGLDEVCPDLAIWIYPQYRNCGYGTKAFILALKYLFNHYGYPELSVGCYSDNLHSIKMLEKVGFSRYPEGDIEEISVFTGEPITQLEFRILRDKVI